MPMISLMHVLRLFLIVCLLGALAGCFGDGRGDKKISDAAPAAEAGILVNAAVSGAAFATRTQSGLTGAGGQFTYARGEDITFTVGTIDLGTVQAAEILTPVELTGSNTPVDQSATNMFVFLQTIDENSPDYDDGIEISAATRTALEGQELNFDTDSETFTNNLQDLLDAVLPGKTIVSEEDALDNFCNGTYLPLGGQSTFGYPFPGCEAGGTVELLTNGSFELPDASGGDIGCSFSWDCFNSSFTNSNLFDDGNGGPAARTGTQVLKQFGDDGGAFQDVDATPGATYTASIWAQNWSGDPLNRLVLVQLFFLDGSGNILEQNETFGTPLDPPGGANQTYLPPDTWVELSIQRVAPANTATARIQVIHLNNDTNQTGDPGGSVFWDDASLTGPGSTPPPTEEELLTNESYELPDASGGDIGCSFSWDCFNSSFTNSNLFDDGNGGPTARTGTQILKQFGDDGGAFQDVDAMPGETYTASIWAQNWSGDPLNRLVILQLFFLDGSGNILEQNETFGTPLDPPGGVNQTYLPPDTWVELSIQRVAPANTATARIQVIHLNNDTNQTGNPGGSVFWDDASLTGPGSTPPPPPDDGELLTNESYELPDASGGDIGCSFSWDCFNSSFTNSNLFDDGNGGPTARTGTQILKQFGDDGGAFQDVDAMPGETYTASIWAQNWSGDPLNRLVILQLFFLDGSGNILEQNETFGTPLDPPGGVNQTYLPPDTWVELSIQRVAPANTATARIQVIHLNNDTNQTGNPGGSVFWDDASLTGPVDDVPEGFELVFSDEFNDQGPVSPDSNKWTAEEGNGPPENPVGFGNNEWQEYTANLENLRVEDGNLVIQARCETTPCISETVNPGNGSITSAKIITRDKFEFQYGIVRARIKAAGGLAAWPAFWMLGADYPITPWPNAGEIDIMELFQNNSSPFETHSTIHFCNQLQSAPEPCNFSNGYDFITDSLFALERWSDDFHIYELEWNADRIIMRVDGDEVFNNAINPAYMEEFRKPFYLILNLAMGGNLGPGGNLPPDPNRTFIETSLIDWVRVYQPVP